MTCKGAAMMNRSRTKVVRKMYNWRSLGWGGNHTWLNMSGCQAVLPQLEVGCLCRVVEVNAHGYRHRGPWLQPLWEWKRGEGRQEEKRNQWVTRAQCAVWGRWREGRWGQQQSGTDRHPHHLCFLLHKARPPCVRNLSFNLIPHTSASATKNKKHEGLAYFQNNRLVKGRETEVKQSQKCWRVNLDSWMLEVMEEEEEEREVNDEKNTERQKHPACLPTRPAFLSLWSRPVYCTTLSTDRRGGGSGNPVKNRAVMDALQSSLLCWALNQVKGLLCL